MFLPNPLLFLCTPTKVTAAIAQPEIVNDYDDDYDEYEMTSTHPTVAARESLMKI